MKKQALISALLLANPLMAMAGTQLANAKVESLAARADLLAKEFRSQGTYKSIFSRYDAVTGEWVEKEVEVFYRLKFLQAGTKDADYEFDGEGELDYEVVVEKVDVATGEVDVTDTTYYLKKSGRSKVALFNCDSTNRCWTDINNTTGSLFNLNGGKALKLKNKEQFFFGVPEKEVLFLEVR